MERTLLLQKRGKKKNDNTNFPGRGESRNVTFKGHPGTGLLWGEWGDKIQMAALRVSEVMRWLSAQRDSIWPEWAPRSPVRCGTPTHGSPTPFVCYMAIFQWAAQPLTLQKKSYLFKIQNFDLISWPGHIPQLPPCTSWQRVGPFGPWAQSRVEGGGR